jgi:hypothetical protein
VAAAASGSAGPSGDTQALLRLGWALAELRGRWRQHLTDLPLPASERRKRTDYALPLNHERSSAELGVQAAKELQSLAASLQLDKLPLSHVDELGVLVDVGTPPIDPAGLLTYFAGSMWQPSPHRDPGQGADAVAEARHELWNQAAHFFYDWDAAIQDHLLGDSFSSAAAYQLGRGLAETYWALQPSAGEKDIGGWHDVLGPERQRALNQMLAQLAPPLDTVTVAALRGSLATWCQKVSAGEVAQGSSGPDGLYQQIQRWHLVLVEQVPVRSFIDEETLWRHAGKSLRVLQAFWGQIVLAAVGFGSAAVAVALLSTASSDRALGAILAILGLFGVTSAGVVARAKASANASLAKLREALDQALAADAITVGIE